MKLTSFPDCSVGAITAICALFPLAATQAAVTVDGIRDVGESYFERAVQGTTSN